MKQQLTPELARAAGRDAANERMRKGGRTAWNEADFNLAAKTTNRLMAQIEGRWISSLSPVAQRLMDRHMAKLQAA